MNVRFEASFTRDVRKIKDRDARKQVQKVVEQVEQSPTLQGIAQLKKLEGLAIPTVSR